MENFFFGSLSSKICIAAVNGAVGGCWRASATPACVSRAARSHQASEIERARADEHRQIFRVERVRSLYVWPEQIQRIGRRRLDGECLGLCIVPSDRTP